MKLIEQAAGSAPERVGSHGEHTYQVGGRRFFLRTRARDEHKSGLIRYWFGLRESCWADEDDYFVLVCDLDFVLVIPVVDWLPYHDMISIAKKGTSAQSRQPHIVSMGGRAELREGALILDVARWRDRFDLLGPS